MKRKSISKKKRRFSKKRKYAKSKGRKTRITNLSSLTPFAANYVTKLRYFQNFAVSPTAGLYVNYAFNLNNIYDPDQSGVGHQPMGHDELQALYNRYRVYKFAYKVTVFTPSLDMVVNMNAVNNGMNPANPEEAIERGGITKVVHPNAPNMVFKGVYYLPKVFGVLPQKYKDDPNYTAPFGSGPSEAAFFNILTQNYNGIQVTVRYNVQLTYYVECFDPKPMVTS